MNKTIGIIGGGQLAQMMALAAYPLGLKVICLDPISDCPAGRVTEVIVGDYKEVGTLKKLAAQADVVTYEFENISATALMQTEASTETAFFPASRALQIAQDRLLEKQFFEHLNIPTTHYIEITSLDDIKDGIEQIGLPAILKTRHGGYDGKGQIILKDTPISWEACDRFLTSHPSKRFLLENYIAFKREISCIAARSQTGEISFYSLIENQHKEGILRLSRPLKSHPLLEKQADTYLTRILVELNYVGILTVEFFEKEGELIANEMAPRVHNSGHWTIEGADTSQFENHIRAICGLPLGSTETRGQVALFNLIGEVPSLEDILCIDHAHYHLYGKSPRPGRKLGHITLTTENQTQFKAAFKVLNNKLMTHLL